MSTGCQRIPEGYKAKKYVLEWKGHKYCHVTGSRPLTVKEFRYERKDSIRNCKLRKGGGMGTVAKCIRFEKKQSWPFYVRVGVSLKSSLAKKSKRAGFSGR